MLYTARMHSVRRLAHVVYAAFCPFDNATHVTYVANLRPLSLAFQAAATLVRVACVYEGVDDRPAWGAQGKDHQTRSPQCFNFG